MPCHLKNSDYRDSDSHSDVTVRVKVRLHRTSLGTNNHKIDCLKWNDQVLPTLSNR